MIDLTGIVEKNQITIFGINNGGILIIGRDENILDKVFSEIKEICSECNIPHSRNAFHNQLRMSGICIETDLVYLDSVKCSEKIYEHFSKTYTVRLVAINND